MSLQHDDRLRALTHQDADFWADLVDDVLIVAITDRDGVITYVNDKFCKVSKYSAKELLGSTHRLLNSGYHDAAFFQEMYRTIQAGQPWRGNICNRAKDGTIYWVATTIIPKCSPTGEVEGYVASRFEITELMKTKERLSELAETDTLTALLNRGGFNTALSAALGLSSKEPPQSRALVMFDLDGFKQINDIHGHHAGDIVLRVVASRLVELTDPDDPISRLGGDEFAIVLNKTLRSVPLEKYMDRLQAALERPIDIETVTVSISGSIGAVFLDARESVEDMQKNADMALYAAKRAGGKQAQMFTSALRHRAQVRTQILIEARSGVKNGQFEVYYQPILNCHTCQLDQIEALLRWHHPERGLLAAEDFADVFTDSTLTQAMGPSMIASFQRDVEMWNRTGQPPRQLAINMSRMDLGRAEYRVELEQSLRDFGLSPANFVLEVTEPMLQGRRAEQSMHNIRELGAAGFQIAMDNFGKGETMLRHLRDLPFNQLKIDQSLVTGIVDNAGDREVLASLIGLGQVYGLEVTVEGVETRAQFEIVHMMKPDRVQGFFISPALSSQALLKLPSRFEIAA
ncbi:EAL domain-containing protein [Novacetimonas hansenii]|uniref:GGDEF domain-containing protein n=2 Tax=Novacetimonas hansenii TaxID=436 RepID=A0ABQ0SF50_NOVHA|nr:EAL domain-containing protein [Novacetimonas hansenii]EFG83103.1 diguanylate cyclase/phosphodiesterase with PAS/PAC sensor(s) [Novacetimonas hansenii ATCC 23769]PYD73428.1 GGDEF domain-containing protein [Novacetimonas hansenii]RFP00732.1 diguanylate cyclase [Novacetimonas hansenii]WEQ58609.1 EAL domain-containing protein [Novacetimonas hansenii]CUW48224.1 diguanylate cyclase [Novacetimonas hansenii]